MNTKQIKYAIELSKSLNFSDVAKKLGISQPALSKQISNLEKELGVELFNRRKNPIELTYAGEYFLNEAQNLMYREEQLYRSMADFSSGEKGSLSIGISPFRCTYLMPDVCQKIKEKYPGVKITLHEYSSDILRRKAAEGKYDFAIMNLPVDEAVFDATPIEQDTLVVVVPKNIEVKSTHLNDAKFPQIDFKDCGDIPFIVVSPSQEMRVLFEKICTASNIQPNISMEVVGLITAWEMAQKGIGATLLPLQFVQNNKFFDNVNIYIPNCDTNIRQPAIITRHGQYLSEYAKYAIKLITEK